MEDLLASFVFQAICLSDPYPP
jgi:hypothetical protein